MKKPRLVLILASFPQISETFIVNKFVALLDHGWDVHVECRKHARESWGAFPQFAKRRDLPARVHQTWPVSPKWLAILLSPLAFLTCLLKNPIGLAGYLKRGLKRHGFGVIKRFYLDARVIALKPSLVHFEFGATAVERADLNDLLGCVGIVSFRGYDLNFSGLDVEDYYKEVWKFTDGFHFLGEDLHQRALRRGLPPEKPYALIPPAIDTEFFSPAKDKDFTPIGSAERPLRLLSVGRLEWKKGYEHALTAVSLLREQGICCEYRIIGAGASLTALVFARHQLGLEKTVTLLGALPRENVKDALEWSDVFLHAAVSEGFCNAVLEAQSMRVPVVATDAGGLPENVAHGLTGFVVARRSPTALAARLAELAADADLRRQMGSAGRARVVENFQLDGQISRFINFYHSLYRGSN